MPFEDFDKRIRDAADNHHPSYEEKAWTKMETLLDKHLPVEKNDRRRIIFFLLLFLLLAGGAWLLISKPWQQAASPVADISKEAAINPAGTDRKNNDRSATAGNTDNKVQNSAGSANPQAATTADPNHPVQSSEKAPATIPKQGRDAGNDQQWSGNSTHSNDVSIMVSPGQKARKNKAAGSEIAKNNHLPVAVTIAKSNPDETTTKPVDDFGQVRTQQTNNPDNQQIPAALPGSVNPANHKDSLPVIAQVKTDDKAVTNTSPLAPQKKKAGKKQKENGLFFTASAGPDISAVGFDKIGKIRPVYGLGLAYTLNRFTIRSGFYAVKKTYSAAPDDYKPANPPNPNYLYQIDANCKVFEIPVSVAFNFAKAKNHGWFGAAGLSSYLMKEEEYDYVYKYPGGLPMSYKWTVKNKNKHIFSVLSLSGGYTRTMGKTFSFSAEPYLKIPLTGIGLGNVQLNSAGILFTVGARLTGKNK